MLGFGGHIQQLKASHLHTIIKLDSDEFRTFLKDFTDRFNRIEETRLV